MTTRNLDLTALRSFAAVADSGGVTRAAAQINLTQSAVSMQLKRLEAQLGLELFDRSGRAMALTPSGEQLLAYTRRLLAVNDEAWGRLTHPAFEGVVDFGVPHDIIYPHVPGILRSFAAAYPRVKLQLHALYTSGLKDLLARGEMDIILTTEGAVDPGGETLARQQLVWAGAPSGQAWRQRPLRYASCGHCVFKRPAIEALERAGIPWELAVDSISPAAVDASVAADLAVSVHMQGGVPGACEIIRHGGALPELPEHRVNMYVAGGSRAPVARGLAAVIRRAYGVADSLAAE